MSAKGENGSSNGDGVSPRLPKNVTPSHYDITIEPDLVNFTFTGSEQVSVQVTEPTSKIIVNGNELEILAAEFETATGPRLSSKDISYDEKEGRITLAFSEELKPGSAKLHLSFKGTLNDRMKGFYRAKYPSADGSTPDRYIATTQFEAVDARLAFPCWDEPAIKATFKITLVAPKGHQALSNMPVVSEKPREDGKNVFEFDVTPIMSTYLVAFIVGEFEYIETKSKSGIPVRVYTAPGQKEQGRYALDMTAQSLDYYTDYFDIPYPLPKMDLVTISDFCAGAMENWGLTTYREARLLFDPKIHSADYKQLVAQCVAHEMAHQWFGNLVTMEWWTHLWLNEGFARFMENVCTDALAPEFKMMDQCVTSVLLSALGLDALRSSHPVEVPIHHPSEIDEIFDKISYDKGCSVIVMLFSYIGAENFKKGLSVYLNRFKYKNAETNDLWAALEEISGKPVCQVMSTWTKQKGFPLITVTETQDSDNRVLNLTQEKFSADGELTPDEKEYLWMVPISVISASSPDKVVAEFLLSSKTSEFVVPNVKPGEWVKLNSRFSCVSRVEYPESMLQSLVPAITSKCLPSLDRVNIVSDIFALVSAGKASTVEALKVVEALKDEDDFCVWSTVASCLASLSTVMSNSDLEDSYREWGRSVLSIIKTKVSWQSRAGESHLAALLRGTIFSLLSSFDEPSVLEESKRIFDAYASQNVSILPEVRVCVFNSVAKRADASTLNTLMSLFKKSEDADERKLLCAAMGRVRDPLLINDAITFFMEQVRPQDLLFAFESLATHKLGRGAAWQYFKEHFDVFSKRYRFSLLFPRIIKGSFSSFASPEKADEIASFFEDKSEGLGLTISQVVESVRLNAAWLARDQEAIKKYFNSS